MTRLFAPLGFTPNLALAPLRHYDIDEVHIFYGSPMPDDGRMAVADSRATCKTLGVKLVEHKVKNVWDYEAIIATMTDALEAVEGEVLVNGSGGTRVMVMAATIFSFTHDVPLLYYDEVETKDGVVVPLRAFRSMQALGDSQLAIMANLRGGPIGMTALAKAVGLAPSTLTAHVKRLEKAGIVAVERRGKSRLVHATAGLFTRAGEGRA